jgi:hypothetical protein
MYICKGDGRIYGEKRCYDLLIYLLVCREGSSWDVSKGCRGRRGKFGTLIVCYSGRNT